MATIKAIEGRSVHQIQSGQVIVDLCSVVKELVENSLDAGSTSIDVRFKNHGLESIEVQDNGSGISPENYSGLALKHYTSKLANYDDLSSLKTFGFRGEALSSLCALSTFHVITARAEEVPKGTRLDFETSGALKGTKVVASQQGTTVAVENLFKNLPVRRRELEKNIKREYGKVLGVLQAYACISKGVKFGVSHQLANGKKAVVFATKSNPSTRENIANVFGAKTLPALIQLDLKFELQSGAGQRWSTQEDGGPKEVRIVGHISKPIFGEGRQTPDRQMFFVNARPCNLPQVAKAFNEVYKSYNISQSPFICANLVLDTNAYDVNVSPDKRTILLHDQNAMLEAVKTSVTELFDRQDHTVPNSQLSAQRMPPFRQLTLNQETNRKKQPFATSATRSADEEAPSINESDDDTGESRTEDSSTDMVVESTNLIQRFVGRNAEIRANPLDGISEKEGISKEKQKLQKKLGNVLKDDPRIDDDINTLEVNSTHATTHGAVETAVPVLDFNQRIAEQVALRMPSDKSSLEATATHHDVPGESRIQSLSPLGVTQAPLTRVASKRNVAGTATITIGSKTIVSSIDAPSIKRQRVDRQPYRSDNDVRSSKFGSSLRAFTAPGTELEDDDKKHVDEDEDEGRDSSHGTARSDPAPRAILEDVSPDVNQMLGILSDDSVTGGSCAGQKPLDSQEEDSAQDSLGEADITPHADTDEDYLAEAGERAQEEARIAQLIQRAEEDAARPSKDNEERAKHLLNGRIRKDSTTQLMQAVNTNGSDVAKLLENLAEAVRSCEGTLGDEETEKADYATPQDSAEEYLSLTVLKDDFARMRVVGQFNLGFILVTRPANSIDGTKAANKDEVFIIDQHASDEKYNFERLQSETTVQNQPLVRPQYLDLTAMEEEIIIGNVEALEKNGFLIEVDSSGDTPVGKRCRLVSLPMSREVVFNARDLEELLALLAESPLTSSSNIPRPSKVRRMFAMRACRSSVMVGKTLTRKQMGKIVQHMGEIDKPWNCPHGRPTMRHLMGLNTWCSWTEGDGIGGLSEQAIGADEEGKDTVWARYIEKAKRHA